MRWRTARRAFEGLLLVVLAAFVARYLARHAADVRDHAWSFEAAPLVAGTALAALALLGYAILWARLVRGSDPRVSVRGALPIWFVANLARYVPGKVWQFSGMAYLARRRGVSTVRALGASVLLQLLVVATGALLLGALLPGPIAETYGGGARVALLGGAALAAAFFLSPLFDRSARALAGRLGSPRPLGRLSSRRKLLYGAATGAAWLVYGLGFWLFLTGSVGHTPPPATACGIFIAGYLAGFLAFFAPGGLGVREGAYVVLLQPYLAAPVALAAALLSRVWLTLIEVALALVTTFAARTVPGAAAAAADLEPFPSARDG